MEDSTNLAQVRARRFLACPPSSWKGLGQAKEPLVVRQPQLLQIPVVCHALLEINPAAQGDERANRSRNGTKNCANSATQQRDPQLQARLLLRVQDADISSTQTLGVLPEYGFTVHSASRGRSPATVSGQLSEFLLIAPALSVMPADANAGDRNYLVLARPNVIMNDIRLRGLAVARTATGRKSPTTTPRPLATSDAPPECGRRCPLIHAEGLDSKSAADVAASLADALEELHRLRRSLDRRVRRDQGRREGPSSYLAG